MESYPTVMFKYVTLALGGLIVIANTWKLLILRRERVKISSIFIRNLAACDLSAGLIMVALKTLNLFMKTSLKGNLVAKEAFSLLRFWGIRFTLVASVLNLISIAISQVIAVRFPYLYRKIKRRTIYLICGLIWFLAASTVLTLFLYVRFVDGASGDFAKKSDLMFPAVTYPAVLVFVSAYSYILWIINRGKIKLQSKDGGTDTTQHESKASKFEKRFLHFAIKTACIFAMCWIPSSTCRLSKVSNLECSGNYLATFFPLAFMSALINPFLYRSSNKNKNNRQYIVESSEMATTTTRNGF